MDNRSYSGAQQGLKDGGGKKPAGKAHVTGMHVRRGADGKGYIAKHTHHEYKDGSPHHGLNERQPEYPLADKAALLAHLEEHLGEPAPGGEEAAEEAAAGSPQAAE